MGKVNQLVTTLKAIDISFEINVKPFDNFKKIFRILTDLMVKDDFQLIILDTDIEGYYSYKKGDWEVCVDHSFKKGWIVSLCNKFEEVVEEYVFNDEATAFAKSEELIKKY